MPASRWVSPAAGLDGDIPNGYLAYS